MNPNDRVLITGGSGLVGSAIVRELSSRGFKRLIVPPHTELELINQVDTRFFFKNNSIDYVFHCAARVGGIQANSENQAGFLYDNLMMSSNVIHCAHESGVKKLLFLGSSCIYPRLAGELQEIKEDALLSGPLEPTNEGYAIAKIAGLKLCEHYQKQYGDRFISAMLTNAYGPYDCFDLNRSHIIPALMRRFHEAKRHAHKTVAVWGSGKPIREFLHADDLARALILMMEQYEGTETVNIGHGAGVTVHELANLMLDVIGFTDAGISFDLSKPDGTPRKILDVSKIKALGWEPQIPLKDGLRRTYDWAQKYHPAFTA